MIIYGCSIMPKTSILQVLCLKRIAEPAGLDALFAGITGMTESYIVCRYGGID
jgi:hypothetical protein